MKTIFITSAILLMGTLSFAASVDSSRHVQRSGSWQCVDNVTDHDGDLMSGCGMGRWACYEMITRKCENMSTGQRWEKSFKKYTGVCARTLTDCW